MYSMLLPIMLLGWWPATNLIASQSGLLASLSIAPPAKVFSIEDTLSASGILIIDVQSGQPIYGKTAAIPRPMASLTKLMTALLIVENHSLDEVVTIPAGMENVVGNRAYLATGDTFTVGELLSALLIASANDAAVTLAQYHSGTVDQFVVDMNTRAAALGLRNTSYQNPAGLDHPRQYSSPQDIAWLTTFVLRQPEIAKRMGQAGARISNQSGTEIALSHTHALLHRISPVIAGKTGTTNAAGECLVSIVEFEGREYLVVLLGSRGRYEDMRLIFRTLGLPVA